MNFIAVFSKFTRNPEAYILKHVQLYRIVHRNNSNDSISNNKQDEEYDKNVKQAILNASLPFVNQLGWSKEALIKGAESIGYPGVTHGLLSQGGADLVHHFYTECNKKLAEILKKESKENKNLVPSEFVQNAVETRLRMIVPYKAKWPQAVAIMTLPPNVPTTLANLLTLVDDICYYAGDRSVDIKWYSRRIALGGLYKATELYLIQDQSEDHKKTWEFLSRRIEELFQIQALLSQTENIGNVASETFTSAFATARHMLGINWNR